jgi:Zn-dependent protease with chaperone function
VTFNYIFYLMKGSFYFQDFCWILFSEVFHILLYSSFISFIVFFISFITFFVISWVSFWSFLKTSLSSFICYYVFSNFLFEYSWYSLRVFICCLWASLQGLSWIISMSLFLSSSLSMCLQTSFYPLDILIIILVKSATWCSFSSFSIESYIKLLVFW